MGEKSHSLSGLYLCCVCHHEPAERRSMMMLAGEEMKRMVERLSQLTVLSNANSSEHCISFSSYSELSARSSPWPSRLPVMWLCLPQAGSLALSGSPFALRPQSHQLLWLEAERSPTHRPDLQPSVVRTKGASVGPVPTHLLTQAQLPELWVRPGPLTCSPSPNPPYWFALYVWACVSLLNTGPHGLEADL